MPEDEFELYFSGKAVPPGSWEMHFSESIHTMQEMSNVLTDLERRHLNFLKNAEALKDKMRESQVMGFLFSLDAYKIKCGGGS
jgi:hypothetical protein